MAQQLPCDGEGVCMSCKTRVVAETETICCKTCGSQWHASCLSKPIESLLLTLEWVCPDCCYLNDDNNDDAVVSNDIPSSSSIGESSSHDKNDLVRLMRAIEADSTLNDQQKAKKRQELMTGKTSDDDDDKKKKKKTTGGNDVMDILGDNLICIVCRELPERPVTTPCGHNFCLKCFEKWARQGNFFCPNCCRPLPQTMINNPRINSALVIAIRMAKVAQKNGLRKTAETVCEYVNNQNKPDKAYTTERAKRSGKANACSGKIFVTVPNDHFGPILADNDPERNQGVLVGESWEDRLECRQWGAHFPHVAGIAGQSKHGSQSIVLSGGYADDEDHGEWFLYTGSDEHGDRPRPLPVIKELNGATNLTERTDSPSWDYDDEESCWKWKKPPPSSKTPVQTGNPRKEGKGARNASLRDKVLKEFKCQLCRQVMSNPLTTPCAHNFCKHCLEAFFVGQSSVRKRSYQGRTLRAQKTIMKCPLCTTDLSEFLQNPQVNRELMEVIKNLQRETEEESDRDLIGETDGLENIAEAAEDDNSEIEGEAK
ncbi:hypothetical protein MKW92_039199 [Papaver armeniacum]|nr:hypothetical protein MKW92_039199 [Papaver armeniacum]